MNLRLYSLKCGKGDSRVYDFCFKNSNPFVTVEVSQMERVVRSITSTDPVNIDALLEALKFVNENEYGARWVEQQS